MEPTQSVCLAGKKNSTTIPVFFFLLILLKLYNENLIDKFEQLLLVI